MENAEGEFSVVRIQSAHGADETLDRLERLLKERGLIVFVRMDFSGDATGAGMAMRREQMLIFGNPKSGTAPMQSSSDIRDRPAPEDACEDAHGETWLAYNGLDYIGRRHGLAPKFGRNLLRRTPNG